MRIERQKTPQVVATAALLFVGLAAWSLWRAYRDFELFAPYVATRVTEGERTELERKTGLRFPAAARFVWLSSRSRLQGVDMSLKLRLPEAEMRRFVGQPGLVEYAPAFAPDPMLDDPEAPPWRPSAVRKPLRRQSKGDGGKEPKVHILAEAAPGEPHVVYVAVSDALDEPPWTAE